MEAFLYELAQVELFDAVLFHCYPDELNFKARAPEITAYRSDAGKLVFESEILNYPIAYSVAVYPDLNQPASMTPLLWTRGLHHYASFDRPYAGHIAFLDGHIIHVEGTPGSPDPELSDYFGPNSEFSKAIRILEHEPEGWSEEPLAPLPIRYDAEFSPSFVDKYGFLLFIFGPGLIAGVLVMALPKPSKWQRIRSGLIAFALVFTATLVLSAMTC
ncbi:hypothetical protein [Coraliomargarita parva]|uniref:hypothetical protein n=1 Tax=Coraliomargarita parva TaxID=3014050 RepID=UPI0022B47D77|nr:hypothetical protein [Coraliomargarita parva]